MDTGNLSGAEKQTLLNQNFELLAADLALPKAWRDAAGVITLRSDIRKSEPNGLSQTGSCIGANPVAFGESLRSRREPSVTELLAKRVSVLAASQQPAQACSLAFQSYIWEPKSALPVLQEVGRLQECRADRYVAAARIALGDSQAAADWVVLIKKVLSTQVPLPVNYGLVPRTSELSLLWMFPAEPTLREFSEWLFGSTESLLCRAGISKELTRHC